MFWPFIPRRAEHAAAGRRRWYRVADWVSNHAGRVAVGSLTLLAVLCTGLLGTPDRTVADRPVPGEGRVGVGLRHPGRPLPRRLTRSHPVIGRTDRADELRAAIESTPGVVSVTETRPVADRRNAVLGRPRRGTRLARGVRHRRRVAHGSVRGVDDHALVGGSDAQALDARNAAQRDQRVVIPAILVVVLVVLYVLLRAALAPLILVAVTVLSALAALGLGGWVSVHVFGFPALDNTTPLFAILFLVALGVDYTIFLVTRAREETHEHGTREGIVRAVSATGAVITSAGIVLAAVFAVLGVLPLIVLTQIGIIVGLGILLDTFLVRTVIIPALFTLIGPRIWWPARVDSHVQEVRT